MDPKTSQMQDQVRDMSTQGVEQVRESYNRFMEASRTAQDKMTQAGGEMAGSAAEIQRTMMKFTEDNMQSGFDFATRLAQAKDFSEVMSIQADYARSRVEAYSAQTKEITRLVSEAAGQAKPSA